MLSEINKIINQVKSFESKDPKDIEAFRLKILGKKGHIADFFSKFKNVKNSEKKIVGQQINLLKTLSQEKINQLKKN